MPSPEAEAPRRIEFSVLGPLRVTGAGRSVEVGPGRRRATLAALIADVDRVVSLETLVARVWDEPPAHPTSSVHTYVSRLRSALRTVDEDGLEIAAALLTEAPGYRLAVDPDSVDAVRFERALRHAHEIRSARPEEAREVLERGLALWRGAPYADTLTAFTEAEAERLLARRVDAQELLVGCDLDLGRHAAVISAIEELVAAEPLREPRHAALMLALYRSGRQAEALRHFERLRETLADELGVDPSRELQELHTSILRQDPALDPPRFHGPPIVALTHAHAATEVEAIPALRMVGRDHELAQVRGVLESAWSGAGPIAAVVLGEAGIGKSRLLEEAALRAGREGVLVAWGRCWQHDGAPLLWPWLQLVRGMVEQLDESTVMAALGGRGSAVRRLLPELALGHAGAEESDATSLEESQVRLFDGLCAFIDAVAAGRRVLLVLEDMHWADEPSRRLAEYLVTHVAGHAPAVLVSVRTPSEDATVPSRALLAGLSRTGRTVRVPVGGLDADDVRQYVADRTGALIDDATATALVERTEGNPFFVGELVRLLVTDAGDAGHPVAPAVGAVEGTVPESIREVVLRRLQLLGADELAVLRAAAVVGRTFDLDLIHEVSGADEDVVDEVVDRATAAGFLVSGRAGHHEHRFTHALVQQTLFEDTGPARRRRLHTRIAAALTRRAGDDLLQEADRLIHHLGRAGGSANLEGAVDLCIRVADAARRSSNYPEVEAVLLQALDHLAGVDAEAAPAREMAVRVRLCLLYDYFYRPSYPPTVAHRERALELARHSSSTRDRIAALGSAAAVALGSADFVRTDAVLEEMLLSAEANDDEVMRAAALALDGQSQGQQGRHLEAIDRFTHAIEASAGFDTSEWADILSTPLEVSHGWRLFARVMAGQTEGLDEDLEATRALCVHPSKAISAHGNGLLALFHILRDDEAAALAPAAEAFRVMEEADYTAVRGYFTIFRAWADPAAPRDELEAAAARIEGDPTMVMRPFLRDLIADAHLRAGRVADARRHHRLAVAEAELTGNVMFAPGPAKRLAGL